MAAKAEINIVDGAWLNPKLSTMGNQQGNKRHMTKRLTILDDEIQDIYHRYWDNHERIDDIAKDYGCLGSTVANALKRNGYSLRKIGGEQRANALYNLDTTFFDTIDTEEKAYFLGFIASDGHVSKRNVIMFSQHKDDVDVLEKFKKAIKSNAPIRYKKDYYATISVCSHRLGTRLNEIGISHQKTQDLNIYKVLSYIPEDIQIHFARGFFDGDGGIGTYKYSYFKKHQYYVGVTGLIETCKYFKDLWGLNVALCDEGNGFYTCRTGCSSDAVRILEMMYSNATIYMERKYKSYLEMVKIYNQEYAA